MKQTTWLTAAGVLGLWLPLAGAQTLRPGPIMQPGPVVHPGPAGSAGTLIHPGPAQMRYIDTSWQNSPYTYYLIHHRWPPYPYPYPYPYPTPYPVPTAYPMPYYPSPYSGGYGAGTMLPDYYGGTPDPGNPYSDRPTTAVLPPVSGNNAVVVVKVPLALAAVSFDGHQTQQTGKTRVFTTPELTPGKTSTYTVQANWSEGGLPRSVMRQVQVTAGQTVTVDFTKQE